MQIMESQHPLRRRNQENFDRFIPCRSAMDFGYAITMLTMKNNERNRKENSSEYSVLYRQKLAEAVDLPSRILAFRNKPLKPIQSPSSPQPKPSKPPRHIPQVCIYFFSLFNLFTPVQQSFTHASNGLLTHH